MNKFYILMLAGMMAFPGAAFAYAADNAAYGTLNAAAGACGVTERSFAVEASAAMREPVKTHNQQNMALAKIRVNSDAAAPAHILVGKVAAEQGMDAAISALARGGFNKVSPLDGHAVAADVSGKDPGDEAVGLAKHYFITEVLVSKKVYDSLFPAQQH